MNGIPAKMGEKAGDEAFWLQNRLIVKKLLLTDFNVLRANRFRLRYLDRVFNFQCQGKRKSTPMTGCFEIAVGKRDSRPIWSTPITDVPFFSEHYI